MCLDLLIGCSSRSEQVRLYRESSNTKGVPSVHLAISSAPVHVTDCAVALRACLAGAENLLVAICYSYSISKDVNGKIGFNPK